MSKPQDTQPHRPTNETAQPTRLWHQWWFWALAIPLGGVMIPILEELPMHEPWFWFLIVIGGLGTVKVLRGGGHEVKQLKRELGDLRGQLNESRSAQRRLEMQREISKQDVQTISDQVLPDGVAVIMFTDIEGFTALIDRHGDEEIHSLLVQHYRIVRRCLKEYDGVEIKQLGDGFMASFSSAKRALLCAARIQANIASFNDSTGNALSVRIGIHAGEPLREEKDFVGQTVNMTERIMDQARGGETYISAVIRNLAGSLKGFQYVDQGVRRLNGIAEPQHLYAFQTIDALSSPLDSSVDQQLSDLEERMENAN